MLQLTTYEINVPEKEEADDKHVSVLQKINDGEEEASE